MADPPAIGIEFGPGIGIEFGPGVGIEFGVLSTPTFTPAAPPPPESSVTHAGMQTQLLTQDTWDWCLDALGNIAIASPPYAVAQDIASGIKTNLGECWYDNTVGVNYKAILGKQPPLGYIKGQFLTMALRVPTVTAAQCFLEALSARGVGGQVIAQSGGQELSVFF